MSTTVMPAIITYGLLLFVTICVGRARSHGNEDISQRWTKKSDAPKDQLSDISNRLFGKQYKRKIPLGEERRSESDNSAAKRAAETPALHRPSRGRDKDHVISLEEEACSSGRVVTCRKGTATSLGYPDAYPPNTTCKWLIRADEGEVIEIDFTDIALGEGDCITLTYRGSSVEFLYNPAVTLCGDSQPKKFTSVGNELELLLTTDGAVEAPGILFNFYVRKPVECEDVIEVVGDSGALSSRDYPEPYEPQAKCLWRIIGPSDTILNLSFAVIAIEQARSCEYDMVTIYDGPTTSDNVIGAYCGHDVPDDVISTSNVVLVALTSDGTSEDDGFMLEWTSSNNQ